ncbi:ABC transporter ATP-binding protein [Lentisphaerota bacterium ZTH]|nr:ABC transporter ATP-binding protein [Lentisphaerota bacterium]WET06605.1 ABC transporter ATP-binding protein [Lentisphaerota bacterium ZTH]
MKQTTLLKHIFRYKWLLLGSTVCFTALSGTALTLPWMLKVTIDHIMPTSDYFLFTLLCITMLLIYACRGMLRYISNYLIVYAAQRFLLDIRHKLFKHLQSLSLRFYEEYRTGKLISNVINDVALMQMLIRILSTMADGIFLITVSVGLLFVFSWEMALLVLVVLPLHFLNFRYFKKVIKSNSLELREKMSEISANLSETLSGVKVVKAFASERNEASSFFKSLRPTLAMNLKITTQGVLCYTITENLNLMSYLLVIGAGIGMVGSKAMTIGEFVAFYTYTSMMVDPINLLASQSTNISQAAAGARKIMRLLNEIPEIKDDQNPIKAKRLTGNIEFKNVTFGYDSGNPVISNFDLKVSSGRKVALVGSSGSGKSTVGNLLLRFYDVNSGSVSVDGIDIRKYSQESYRKNIGVVLQNPFLFSGSIRDNIAYGNKTASDRQIEEAAAMANVDEFAFSMAKKYGTEVGENGVALSGGQKQRIAIARAILKSPNILLLDEATSALDSVSEFLVQDALDRLMAGRTTIIIAHRLSTIKNADMIAVMEKGKIVETGSHDQLMRRSGAYSRLYNTQQQAANF